MKKIVLGVIAIILIAVIGVGAYVYLAPPKQTTSNGNYVPVIVTKENLAAVMQASAFIQDLPKDAVIAFEIGEDKYTITRGSVKMEEASEYDFRLTLPEKYTSSMGDLCGAIKTGKVNEDLGFESSLSTTSLMWKYKSALKYKDCFGL